MFKLFLLSLSVISYTAVEVQIKFNGNFEPLDANGNPTGWGLTFNGQNTYEIKVDSVVKDKENTLFRLLRVIVKLVLARSIFL
ncbi:hypothetical protein J2W55_004051 [Mucilaginibacter pocheonensis]|uniref:Uncharacterized protein n=1 Tax=Mucilaginibacter pocheonensis TaxID=398050 RepID=A0ABU1THB8_9SPHI|nr:hypothetical protein [Mucilaginibacter pocheonensis]